MKVQKKRSRKVIIILLIVLSALLLALLGGLFYRNSLIQHETAVTDFESCKKATGSILLETYPEQCKTTEGKTFVGPADTAKTTPPKIVLKEYCTTGEKLCFDYPETWRVTKIDKTEPQPGYTGDDLVVIDAENTLPLELHSGIGGLGGTCPDEGQGTVYVLEPLAITKMNGFKTAYSVDQLRVAKVIVKDDSNDKYVSTLYVTGQKEYVTPGTLKACGIFLSEFIYGRHAVESSETNGNPGAFRFGYTGFNPAAFYDSVETAKNAYTSDVYQQAGAILASLRYQ